MPSEMGVAPPITKSYLQGPYSAITISQTAPTPRAPKLFKFTGWGGRDTAIGPDENQMRTN